MNSMANQLLLRLPRLPIRIMIPIILVFILVFIIITILLIIHIKKSKNTSNEDTVTICPECGTPIIAGKNFCTKCGAKINNN